MTSTKVNYTVELFNNSGKSNVIRLDVDFANTRQEKYYSHLEDKIEKAAKLKNLPYNGDYYIISSSEK